MIANMKLSALLLTSAICNTHAKSVSGIFTASSIPGSTIVVDPVEEILKLISGEETLASLSFPLTRPRTGPSGWACK